jgi:23S rRNA (uridine2552-2'-O)-methyltransferase
MNYPVSTSFRLQSFRYASLSGPQWLKRQACDTWVKKAQEQGFRSRSSYKLLQINQKHCVISPKNGFLGVDLGCAPGGWLIAASNILEGKQKIKLIGVDLLDVESFEEANGNVHILKGDLMQENTIKEIEQHLGGVKAIDLLMSDISPNHSGHGDLHHLRSMHLVRRAFELAKKWQAKAFLCKVFNGAELPEFLKSLKEKYPKVIRVKPEASRKESSELYIVAKQQ